MIKFYRLSLTAIVMLFFLREEHDKEAVVDLDNNSPSSIFQKNGCMVRSCLSFLSIRRLLLVAIFIGIGVPLLAQYGSNPMFGLKIGVGRSQITKLSTILVSEDYYTGYSFSDEAMIGPVALLFVNYRINSSRIGLEGQISYFSQSTNFKYSDVKDFNYETLFQYHYLGFGGYIKTYLVGGFNIGVGLRTGINLSPDNLSYSSNSDEFVWSESSAPPSDEETQTELQSVIKGLNVTEVALVACYEFKNGLSIDFCYFKGLNDVVETLVNRYNFTDPRNSTTCMQFTVGYAIGVDSSKKDKRRRR